MRTTPLGLQVVELEISRFPCKELLYMPGSMTTPGRRGARADAPIVLPSACGTAPNECIFFISQHGKFDYVLESMKK
jgi:hypothetical protein